MATQFLAAVREQLGGLVRALEADGYDLKIEGDCEVLIVSIVVARPDACADCLVSEGIFRSIVSTELNKAGLTPSEIRPRYPSSAL